MFDFPTKSNYRLKKQNSFVLHLKPSSIKFVKNILMSELMELVIAKKVIDNTTKDCTKIGNMMIEMVWFVFFLRSTKYCIKSIDT